MSDEQAEELVQALADYDRAYSNGDYEGLAIANTRINELRGAKPLEPAPENAQADSRADLMEDLLPIERALMDGKRRLIFLNNGLLIDGTVVDSNPLIFKVTSPSRIWTVVRSCVQAIAEATDEAEQSPTE